MSYGRSDSIFSQGDLFDDALTAMDGIEASKDQVLTAKPRESGGVVDPTEPPMQPVATTKKLLWSMLVVAGLLLAFK